MAAGSSGPDRSRERGPNLYVTRNVARTPEISNRFEFDRLEALTYALEIASVPEDEDALFQAADYMEQDDLTAFDAYNVAYADENGIISSDKSLDRVTDDRLPIEGPE